MARGKTTDQSPFIGQVLFYLLALGGGENCIVVKDDFHYRTSKVNLAVGTIDSYDGVNIESAKVIGTPEDILLPCVEMNVDPPLTFPATIAVCPEVYDDAGVEANHS